MDITIRHAEPADYTAIQQIYAQPRATAGTLQVPFPSQEMWRERLTKFASEDFILVALVNDKIVGNLGLHMTTRRRRTHTAHIGMGVHDEYQRLGVGSALLAAALSQADNWLNLLRIELTVFTDNAPAITLYKKFGFVIEGTHVAYALRAGVYEDVYAMARLHPNQPIIRQG
jgi:L-phenylalanine/L-methionine N-acetyltransferase